MMNIDQTFRRISIASLYGLAAIGIVWMAGGLGLSGDDIVSLTGLLLAGVVYYELIKLYRSQVRSKP